MKKALINIVAVIYANILRPFIFLFDSEYIHNSFVNFGEILGKTFLKEISAVLFYHKKKELEQNLFGIKFENPIGLSAGFDYQAKLMNILPSLDFGFETIGTITNLAYEGNPKPRLGRLVKTKSLMVNKGFKNEGIKNICAKLNNKKFTYPVGLSIGKTNTKKIVTQKQAIDDIASAFKIAEQFKLNISFYELNISCPNLFGNIEFYEPQKLNDLLAAVFALNLSKPVFIKMPISESNETILKLMNIIIKFPVKAVIIGNLQKDRSNKIFVKEELEKYPVGNFSGMPTQARSNELIRLIYQKYGKQIKIIGVGGVFNGKDAYEKIKSGASLVQLITGLIFEGPQLVSQINYELVELLKKDGFTNISQAIGKEIK
jgi:dihydroorotate dehydrogenase